MSRANQVLNGLLLTLSAIFISGQAAAQEPISFRYFYDDTGQLVRAVDSTGIVIEYVYDAVGNMLEVRRANVNPTQLTILGFSPSQGGVGTAVRIQGLGFSGVSSQNVVLFNGVVAIVRSATATSLVAEVPTGAGSGPVTVTVAPNTATSGLPFTVLATPVITSVTPRTIDVARAPASIVARGVNLGGSQFQALPALSPAAIAMGAPQIDSSGQSAVIPVTVSSSARGAFVVQATNPIGSSETLPSSGNTISVMSGADDTDSDGDGFPDGLEVLFGSDPFDGQSRPDLTAVGDLTAAAVTVVNRELPPIPMDVVSAPVSVVNRLISPPTQQTIVGPAVSVQNTLPARVFPTSNTGSHVTPTAITSSSTVLAVRLEETLRGERLREGQSLVVRASASGGTGPTTVTFTVNDLPLFEDSAPPFELVLTVPFGVAGLRFGAYGSDASGTSAGAEPITLVVDRDQGTEITGRVVDEQGRPISGATVELLSSGLSADFFEAVGPLAELPSFAGVQPTRSTRVNAASMFNPGGAFGFDPFGTGLMPDYAARFSGQFVVPVSGEYIFEVAGGEGARLRLAGTPVAERSSGSGVTGALSGVVQLSAGSVPIEIEYFESGGPSELQLWFTPPGGVRQAVPGTFLVASVSPYTTVTDANGRFLLRGVPTTLNSARVRLRKPLPSRASMTTPILPLRSEGVETGDISLLEPR